MAARKSSSKRKKVVPGKPAAGKRKKVVARTRPRSKGRPKPLWMPSRITISIFPVTGQSGQMQYFTSPNPSAHRSTQDIVRWENQTGVDFRLTFKSGKWPFELPGQDILVPAGGNSGWFIMRRLTPENQQHVTCTYTAQPALDGPPGDPAIDSDF